MLRSLEIVQPREAEFAALRTSGGFASTQATDSLMSFAFEYLCPPQVLILGLLGFTKQLMSPVVVFGRCCLPEHVPGFVDMTLSFWSSGSSAARRFNMSPYRWAINASFV